MLNIRYLNKLNLETYYKDKQYKRFCLYGFLKSLRFYDPFLLLFFLDNEISFSQIGILYATKEIVTTIVEIPSGIIADTYGRKNALLVAFLIYISSFIIFYFSKSFNLLVVGMLLIGLSDAFRSGTHKGMIMDYLKLNNWENHKVDYYGNTRSWSQKGAAISALLAGVIVFYSGSYKIAYLVSIVPYLLNFINVYSYPDALNFSTKNEKIKYPSVKTVVVEVLSAVKNREVIRIVNSAGLHTSFLKAIKDYMQPVMVHIALLIPIVTTMELKSKSGLAIGLVYFLIFMITSYVSKYSSKVLHLKIKNIEKKTLLIGLFSGLLCGILYYFGYWLPTLLLFVLLFVVENFRKPILTGSLVDNVPTEVLTSVISYNLFIRLL